MDKELKDSIDMLRNTDISTIENAENIDLLTYSYAVKTVLNYIENSIPKKVIKEKYLEMEKEYGRKVYDKKYDRYEVKVEEMYKAQVYKELLEVE